MHVPPDRFAPNAIDLRFLPVKTRLELKIYILTNKSLLLGELRYIKKSHSRLQQASYHQHYESDYQNQKLDLAKKIRATGLPCQRKKCSKCRVLATKYSRKMHRCVKRFLDLFRGL